ncbi:MAG: acetate--CoA ligase [Planctomycetota bacterium]|nr:acetate--CoA ligase [Planctomycetota bacterium]
MAKAKKKVAKSKQGVSKKTARPKPRPQGKKPPRPQAPAGAYVPPETFSRRAHVKSMAEYEKLHRESAKNPEKFWAGVAKELHWFEPWTKALEWKAPHAKWFVGGKTNLSYNCLDRHLSTHRRNKAAIVWEGEPGDVRTLTYQQLHSEVCRFANALKSLGVGKGDRVAVYMGMVPELAVTILACARIGAIHSVVFGGFSTNAIVDRVHDCQAKAIVTCDGAWRRGSVVPLKKTVDEAVEKCPTIENVVVCRRTGNDVAMHPGRDHWWHELVAGEKDTCPATPLDSEHSLFILYTSGSTGKPKGIHHTTGGYMTGTYLTSKLVFDLRDEDVYWCTADIGWVTGHSYIVYGPLANGATSMMYEGAPNHPAPDRFWEIIERHKVNVFYTAPTAIRAFIKWGEQHPNKHDLSSLRLLGTVGEPINPEAWRWYHAVIGHKRCPIVDTWWQTETGSIMISPLPGATPTKPGSATMPLPGIFPEVVDKATGKAVPDGEQGLLVVRKPWPSMLRGIWGDDKRFKDVYWSAVEGSYFTGDGAVKDADGYFWIIGRVDDVIIVSGHNLGTAEVESALVSHPSVAEAAVIGVPDEMTGHAIAAFVTLKDGKAPGDALKDELKAHVAHEIGPIAKPKQIRFTGALPKTRSGKIMRRLLRDIASGKQQIGDTTTLEDYSILAKLKESDEG